MTTMFRSVVHVWEHATKGALACGPMRQDMELVAVLALATPAAVRAADLRQVRAGAAIAAGAAGTVVCGALLAAVRVLLDLEALVAAARVAGKRHTHPGVRADAVASARRVPAKVDVDAIAGRGLPEGAGGLALLLERSRALDLAIGRVARLASPLRNLRERLLAAGCSRSTGARGLSARNGLALAHTLKLAGSAALDDEGTLAIWVGIDGVAGVTHNRELRRVRELVDGALAVLHAIKHAAFHREARLHALERAVGLARDLDALLARGFAVKGIALAAGVLDLVLVHGRRGFEDADLGLGEDRRSATLHREAGLARRELAMGQARDIEATGGAEIASGCVAEVAHVADRPAVGALLVPVDDRVLHLRRGRALHGFATLDACEGGISGTLHLKHRIARGAGVQGVAAVAGVQRGLRVGHLLALDLGGRVVKHGSRRAEHGRAAVESGVIHLILVARRALAGVGQDLVVALSAADGARGEAILCLALQDISASLPSSLEHRHLVALVANARVREVAVDALAVLTALGNQAPIDVHAIVGGRKAAAGCAGLREGRVARGFAVRREAGLAIERLELLVLQASEPARQIRDPGVLCPSILHVAGDRNAHRVRRELAHHFEITSGRANDLELLGMLRGDRGDRQQDLAQARCRAETLVAEVVDLVVVEGAVEPLAAFEGRPVELEERDAVGGRYEAHGLHIGVLRAEAALDGLELLAGAETAVGLAVESELLLAFSCSIQREARVGHSHELTGVQRGAGDRGVHDLGRRSAVDGRGLDLMAAGAVELAVRAAGALEGAVDAADAGVVGAVAGLHLEFHLVHVGVRTLRLVGAVRDLLHVQALNFLACLGDLERTVRLAAGLVLVLVGGSATVDGVALVALDVGGLGIHEDLGLVVLRVLLHGHGAADHGQARHGCRCRGVRAQLRLAARLLLRHLDDGPAAGGVVGRRKVAAFEAVDLEDPEALGVSLQRVPLVAGVLHVLEVHELGPLGQHVGVADHLGGATGDRLACRRGRERSVGLASHLEVLGAILRAGEAVAGLARERPVLGVVVGLLADHIGRAGRFVDGRHGAASHRAAGLVRRTDDLVAGAALALVGVDEIRALATRNILGVPATARLVEGSGAVVDVGASLHQRTGADDAVVQGGLVAALALAGVVVEGHASGRWQVLAVAVVAAIADQAVVDVDARLFGELAVGQATHHEVVLGRLPDVVAHDSRVAGLAHVRQGLRLEVQRRGGGAVDRRLVDRGRGAALNRLAHRRGALPIAVRAREERLGEGFAGLAREGVAGVARVGHAFAVHIRTVKVLGVRNLGRIAVQDRLAVLGVGEEPLGATLQFEVLLAVRKTIERVALVALVCGHLWEHDRDTVPLGIGEVRLHHLRRRPALDRQAGRWLLKLAGVEARDRELLDAICQLIKSVALGAIERTIVHVLANTLLKECTVRVLLALGARFALNGLAGLHLIEATVREALHFLLLAALRARVQGVAEVAGVDGSVRVEHLGLGVLRVQYEVRLAA
mmetsp:Transcript_58451/g.152996  ORF Transcript_58451/g.152996 Transcript_58451/m.152996 type:complete len:1507 (-) Transcript_58451:459-4979(-)